MNGELLMIWIPQDSNSRIEGQIAQLFPLLSSQSTFFLCGTFAMHLTALN